MKKFTFDRAMGEKSFRYYVTSKISENIHETPEGYLVCVGVPIARTGEMIYGAGETPLETKDGKIAIDRSEEEVFRPETIASFEGKAVTITHPTEFVNPENWSSLAKGTIQNVRRGEGDQKDDLIADLLITDSVAISLVKNGLREVSCGYEAEYIQTGEGRGVQTNIVGNHLALVDQGRAGSAYAINDHKQGATKMKLSERIKAIFAKAQDEAMKVAEDEMSGEEGKKEEKKEEAKDMGAYDELVQICKDLSSKVEALSGKKDDDGPAKDADMSEEKKNMKKEEKAGDDAAVSPSVEDRLSALEASVKKLLEMEAKEQAGDEMEEGEMVGDDDMGEEGDMEESEDADVMTGMKLTGDAASRIEILAPGLKLVGKDAKQKALKAAYETADGKKAIETFTGGKAPSFESEEKTEALFIGASELLKVQRASDLSKTKQVRSFDSSAPSDMTAERMNELNQQFYAKFRN